MNFKGIVIALLALILLACAWLLRESESSTQADPVTKSQVDSSTQIEEEAPSEFVLQNPHPRSSLSQDAATRVSPTLPAYPGERPLGRLSVRAIDANSRARLEGVNIRLTPTLGPFPKGTAVEELRKSSFEEVTDEDGACSFTRVPSGVYFVDAVDPEGRRASRRALAYGKRETPVVMELLDAQSGANLHLRVVDSQNQGVARAKVQVYGGVDRQGVLGIGGAPPLEGTSDAEGHVHFPGKRMHGMVAVAETTEGRKGMIQVWRADQVRSQLQNGPLEITVKGTGTLEGKLHGESSLGQAQIRLRLLNNTMPYYTTYGVQWDYPLKGKEYSISGLAPGQYQIGLSDDKGARLILPLLQNYATLGNSVQPVTVEIRSGETTKQDLEYVHGGTISGRVMDQDGQGIAGATIRTTYAPKTSNFPDGYVLMGAHVWRFDSDALTASSHPETHPFTTTDEEGHYTLTGLQPGLHRLEVLASGWTYDRREDLIVEDRQIVTLEHNLQAAGILQGLYEDGGYLGVFREGGATPLMVAYVRQAFTFTGLAPGKYQLSSIHNNTMQVVPLKIVEVVAGRSTWVEILDADLPVKISGQVLDEHGPVRDAQVSAFGRYRKTDANGIFTFQSNFPWTFKVEFDVQIDGIATAFSFPPMQTGESFWNKQVHLGNQTAVVHLFDTEGQLTAGNLEMASMRFSDSPEYLKNVRTPYPITTKNGVIEIERLPVGRYVVNVEFSNEARVSQQIFIPQEQPFEIKAPQSGTVEIYGEDAAKQPLEEWWVDVWTWNGPGQPPEDEEAFQANSIWKGGKLSKEGSLKLRGVQAGELLVKLGGPRTFFGFGQQSAVQEPPKRLQLQAEQLLSVSFDIGIVQEEK